MPRFFFNVYDGSSELDGEGTLLEDWNAARRHAIKLAGRLIDDEAHRIELGELWHMEVTDASGLALFRLDFHVTMAPALLHKKARAGMLP